MGILDALARIKSSFPPVITTNWPGVPVLRFGGEWDGATVDVHDILEMSPTQLWRTQPHLRTVVDFLARNIAQLAVHAFNQQADGDRQRTRTDPAALLFERPNDHMTRYELIYALVGDLALHEMAYWMISEKNGQTTITPIPAAWVVGWRGDAYAPSFYVVQPPMGKQVEVDARIVERFYGWDPINPAQGTSRVTTLKMTLLEQMHAQRYREQQWRRGGRVGAVISRPPGHRWTEDQERKFMAAFKDAYSGDNAPEGGGIPILQDGMTMTRIGFSAKEDEYVEGTKLALTTVAGVFHINPTMLGQLDNANYSNVREFHRMLYGDTLGPWLSQLEDRFNTFVLPRIGAATGVFVEFNIAEKLKGSFEEQAAVLSTSVGAPWMTRNEARARQNLPAIDGGDELVTPLNVLTGGQASPQDGGAAQSAVDLVAARVVQLLKTHASNGERVTKSLPQLAAGDSSYSVKAVATDAHTALVVGALSSFFDQQSRTVLSQLGAKSDEWWNEARWNSELADVLYRQAVIITSEIGAEAARSLGFSAADYNVEQTLAFLRVVSESRAGMINSTTRDQIHEAIASDNPDLTPAAVFALAAGSRALRAGTTLTTTFAAFGTTEAAKQVAPRHATKTWEVNSKNPRPKHAAMNGDTVPVDEKFSNGADWPGDPSLGAAGVAGCTCTVRIDVAS